MICVLHGISIGIAIDISCCADVRICARNTRFSVKEVDIGLAADLGTLSRLPKLVGSTSWVKDVCLSARDFSGEEALAVLKRGALFGEMAVFDRTDRSTNAIANGGATCYSISRADFEMLLDFNRELAYKVLWAVVRLLSARLRSTNDSLRSFLAMSMF